MSRAEVALALAAEAVLEHEGPVSGHAPLLAHLALLQGDVRRRSAETLAATLAAHLVAVLSLPHLQLQRASGAVPYTFEPHAALPLALELAHLKAGCLFLLWPNGGAGSSTNMLTQSKFPPALEC